jgi:hypothetical protein
VEQRAGTPLLCEEPADAEHPAVARARCEDDVLGKALRESVRVDRTPSMVFANGQSVGKAVDNHAGDVDQPAFPPIGDRACEVQRNCDVRSDGVGAVRPVLLSLCNGRREIDDGIPAPRREDVTAGAHVGEVREASLDLVRSDRRWRGVRAPEGRDVVSLRDESRDECGAEKAARPRHEDALA